MTDGVVGLWPILAAVGVAALALTASAHAILTKREVSAAVAWVGLIWLSPLVGAALYSLLGINRIRRRAMELRGAEEGLPVPPSPPASPQDLRRTLAPDGAHLERIARLAGRVTKRPLLAGSRIEPLDGGDIAYPRMIAAIDGAERSLSLASYIFDNDRAGARFLAAIERAVARGVEVRVLIDDMGARYSFPTMVKALRRSGVRTASFLPTIFLLRMPYLNLRNHRKIMVVDGRVGFTGGMNIREEYWSALSGEPAAADLHFEIHGPVVADLQTVFVQDWFFSTKERLIGPRWFPPLEASGETLARGISDGPDIDYEKLHAVILAALGGAEREALIVTPYFIPDTRMSSALRLAAMRGVDVRIVLPEKVNLPFVQWASRPHWGPLLEAGCRIHLTPPPFDHSKLMVVDGLWTLVGSANLDPRSLQLNFEFNVETYGNELAQRLSGTVRERMRSSREVTLAEWNGRRMSEQLREGVARLFSPYL